MDIPLIKLLGVITTPIKWLYHLLTEQTKITISGQESNEQQSGSLLISANNKGEGNLQFVISTASERLIEILKVDIEYSAPLQLHDPNQMGFFQYGMSNNVEFPFRIYCDGSFKVNSELIHAFALTARFPSSTRELPVRISVHARVCTTSVGGFDSYGRSQITRFFYRLVLCDKPLRGIPLPPKHTMTSPQPYLVQSALFASGETLSILIHQQNKDGTVSSELFESGKDQQKS